MSTKSFPVLDPTEEPAKSVTNVERSLVKENERDGRYFGGEVTYWQPMQDMK